MKKRKLFTLIELLVVVAIIGILASILMPSLSKARVKARAVLCKNNLKTIGIANVLYADTNNGYFAPNTKGDGDRWAKYAQFREFTGWNAVTPSWMIPNEAACPEARERCIRENVDFTADAVKDLRCYGPFAIFGSKAHRGLRDGWIASTSTMGYAGDVWSSWQFEQGKYDARHAKKANLAFYDGHVESMLNTVLGSTHATQSPWTDSDGRTATNINDQQHP